MMARVTFRLTLQLNLDRVTFVHQDGRVSQQNLDLCDALPIDYERNM